MSEHVRNYRSLQERCKKIELLILDVDGVMTEGRVTYSGETEVKSFHVRDGSGIRLWQMAGKKVSLISGRNSPATQLRASELGIFPIIQGASDKRPAFRSILSELQLKADQVATIGDDLPDLPLILSSGVGVAVADACEELRCSADYVTTKPGGQGAIRELIEWLLRAQNGWEPLVSGFSVPALEA
jgi:3-deoxy-D-manno-octulosonate 8-phosphate phosphatase (KDO 8-P phosphatase)